MTEELKKLIHEIAMAKYKHNIKQDGECLVWTGHIDRGTPAIEVNIDRKRYRFAPRRIAVGGIDGYPKHSYRPTCGNPLCLSHLVRHMPDATAYQEKQRAAKAELKARRSAEREEAKAAKQAAALAALEKRARKAAERGKPHAYDKAVDEYVRKHGHDSMGFRVSGTRYAAPVRYASVWDYARSGV